MGISSIIERTPRPLLASILPMIGSNEPTIDQRLCDALFDTAIGGRCHSPKPLAWRASLRVADELENVVRQSCMKSKRAWRWTPSQRRSLAEQIRISVFNGTEIDSLIKQRSCKLIMSTLVRVNGRHYDAIEWFATNMPTNATTDWLFYWADKRNKCAIKDRDLVKKQMSTCWWVSYSVERWRELCS